MSALSRIRWFLVALSATALLCFVLTAAATDEDFPTLVKRLQAEKPTFAQRQQALLAQRYDLADRRATVEFFNLVLELKLNALEKKDLVAFMRVL